MQPEQKLARDRAIIARMQKAGIPPHSLKHTLVSIRQMRLASIVNEKGYIFEDGRLQSYYIVDDSPKAMHRVSKQELARRARNHERVVGASLVAAVLGKELVLHNQPVLSLTISGLIQLARDYTDFVVGNGFIVVCYMDEECQYYTKPEWADAQKLLLQHARAGGGLVLGDVGAVENGWLSHGMIDAFEQRLLEFVEVE